MSWRKVQERDLIAKLNKRELDAFKIYKDTETAANPATDIIEQTVEFVRGFCRRNRQLRMCPDASTIPEGLISPAMDYAAFDVLKRINVPINEARKAAWERALDLFKDVASGAYTPESYIKDEGKDDTNSNLALPAFLAPRFKILNGSHL